MGSTSPVQSVCPLDPDVHAVKPAFCTRLPAWIGLERQLARQSLFAVGFRAATALANLGVVPLALSLLGPERYGAWVALTSMAGWFALSDLGLTNGLRNTVVTLREKGHEARCPALIFQLLLVVALWGLCVMLLIGPLIGFTAARIFSATPLIRTELPFATVLIVAAFAVRIVGGLHTPLAHAVGESHGAAAWQLVQQLSLLGLLGLLSAQGTAVTLPDVALLLLLSTSAGMAGGLVYYCSRFPFYRPRPSPLLLSDLRPIFRVGAKIFVVQLAAVVLYGTDAWILIHLFDGETAAAYDVVQKMFAVVAGLFGIALGPVWTAATALHVQADAKALRRLVYQALTVGAPALMLIVALAVAHEPILRLWLGTHRGLTFPGSLVAVMAIHAAMLCWSTVFSYVLNAIERMRLQLLTSAFSILVNIPLSFVLAHTLRLGSLGVILATIACSLPFCLLGPLEVLRAVRDLDRMRGASSTA
ncbi:MAG: oligosaccharide flippase family protein [Proteobacteria bacterium]|nr:oligosaccharide flippase family protein [Pseudomonadota bacterium]